MSKVITNMDMQRTVFVESLYNSLKKQAAKAIHDHKKFVAIASSYVEDGLEENECVELMMIDGLSREASESYVSMAMNKEGSEIEDIPEYSFEFEDETGNIWSSHDIGKVVKASSDEDAWVKAEEAMEDKEGTGFQRIISVNRI